MGDKYENATVEFADEVAQAISHLKLHSQQDIEKYFTEKFSHLGGFSKGVSCPSEGCEGSALGGINENVLARGGGAS